MKKGYARLRTGPLPTYACDLCGHYFSRLSGTPFSHRPFRGQFDQVIALLSQSISCAQAAQQLGVMRHTVRKNVRLIRQWLLELDPSGHDEKLVQLGGHLTAAHDELHMPPGGIACEDRTLRSYSHEAINGHGKYAPQLSLLA
ncbi:DUF746 domain-containing protein [Paraburkholderia ginsengisoli]|uniref:DUF746 domain-containing protein n=1 Tax=Paraburkholderia ginsengisoli TaxID=311231 RepID=A0A7T4N4M2_9BURK|nr:DUF746 domain-containing protein [Paraburkholderia ginsengisoli]QQC65113.1 DUF746 domain-containing protein [Paraburkholderia ginsengisoli]